MSLVQSQSSNDRATVTVAVLVGTRPEAIKLGTVVQELKTRSHRTVVVASGQHREMVEPFMRLFDLKADVELSLLLPGQPLHALSARAIQEIGDVLDNVEADVLVVQGDTSTAFAGSLAAFYHHLPVAHVEAGLRTNDSRAPFPEEMNRRLITALASLHLAPTASARDNLFAERIPPGDVIVTGNTVIDALRWVVEYRSADLDPDDASFLDRYDRTILVTLHRRESWGEPMRQMALALARLARAHPRTGFFLPMHPNPTVQTPLRRSLSAFSNVRLTDPLEYSAFVHVLRSAYFVMTDSGGVQEEAPTFGVPALVTRRVTERMEGLSAGVSRLIGTSADSIEAEANRLLNDTQERDAMATPQSPYGDGHASERVVDALEWLMVGGIRPIEFSALHG